MKHIFIINPAAGKGRMAEFYQSIIRMVAEHDEIDYEIYLSKPNGETVAFIKDICASRQEGEPLRFYACGGDGTLNEVACGIYGFENAELAMIPNGTGNDFVRNFTDEKSFAFIWRQIKGESIPIDVIRYRVEGERIYEGIAVNMCNIGLDSETAYRVQRLKKYPMMTGTTAYVISLISVLMGKLGTGLSVSFDGEEAVKGEYLLTAAGNGVCYGGGFHATPKARLDDGKMDVCVVSKISRAKIAAIVSAYKNGKHLDDEKVRQYVIYRQCSELDISCEKSVKFCVDGEIMPARRIKLSIVEKAVRFSIPMGSEYRML